MTLLVAARRTRFRRSESLIPPSSRGGLGLAPLDSIGLLPVRGGCGNVVEGSSAWERVSSQDGRRTRSETGAAGHSRSIRRVWGHRSEEHTSELQSPCNLV